MSIVQYANICGKRILLTADTGREGLQEVIDYAPNVGLALPGIDRFQVPHHGSRRNVSTSLLDQILGGRLKQKVVEAGPPRFSAIVSSAKADPDHPRKAVIRAMKHRGAKYMHTEGVPKRMAGGKPLERKGWVPVEDVEYPVSQES